MITKFQIFEKIGDPDLRILTEWVECINPLNGFEVGNFYKVVKQFGDPQRASEEFGMEYMPLECIATVYIKNDKGEMIQFIVNSYYTDLEHNRYFLDYFKLMEETEAIKKYNL